MEALPDAGSIPAASTIVNQYSVYKRAKRAWLKAASLHIPSRRPFQHGSKTGAFQATAPCVFAPNIFRRAVRFQAYS